jgi:hypothetical protein
MSDRKAETIQEKWRKQHVLPKSLFHEFEQSFRGIGVLSDRDYFVIDLKEDTFGDTTLVAINFANLDAYEKVEKADLLPKDW